MKSRVESMSLPTAEAKIQWTKIKIEDEETDEEKENKEE